MCDRHLVLGVDIGTTSVKVVVVNISNNEILAKHAKDTQSNVPSDQGTDGNKQDVPTIISALNTCVAKLPKDLLRQVMIKYVKDPSLISKLINMPLLL